ncbi:MAG: O-antigen ligase domain-containing protein [Opitutales bacterium]|nr:O-antigen ligase domain-containing protein [Opitutales bacterium]
MSSPNLAPRYFYIFAIGYATSLIIDPSGNLLPYLSVFMILYGLAIGFRSAAGKQFTPVVIFVIGVLPFAALNCLISSNPTESTLKWFLWLGALIGMALMALRCGAKLDEQLVKNIAPAFFIIWAILALRGNAIGDNAKEKAAALHLSAFYANLVIASGMFIPHKFWRVVVVSIGAVGAVTSGSRAAFLFLPLVFVPGLIYYYRIRFSSAFFAALLIGGLYFIVQNESLQALTFGRKGAEITNMNALELARKSAGGREALREIGIDYIKKQPWGYGYGQSIDIVLEGKNMGSNLHNGYLNVATQMGLHVILVYFCFLIWLIYKLFTDQRVSRISRFFTLSIITCVMLRAVSESFSLFDLGHPASFLCIFLISLFIIRSNNPHKQFV